MFTIILKDEKTGNIEKIEFQNAKLAKIYKEYHLNFGHWNGKTKWIKGSDVVPEARRFIVDEITKLENEVIVHYYQVTDGLIIESYDGNKDDCFSDLRLQRSKFLKQTDWTQLADVLIPQEERKLYRGYRQYLRDLPSLHNEITVLSAAVYNFDEWKSGKR